MRASKLRQFLKRTYPDAEVVSNNPNHNPIIFVCRGCTFVLRPDVENTAYYGDYSMWYGDDTTFEQIKTWVDRRLMEKRLGL